MARSLAGDLIQQLYQAGMTPAQIGKALGEYDPAIIGRVGRGERPGYNLIAPLQGLLKGNPGARPPRTEHQKRIMRDAKSRIISYNCKKPSAARLKVVLRQAERQGATRVGIVADVGKFQGYEHTQAAQHLVRAFRRKGDAATPAALRARLHTSGQVGEMFLLEEIKQATGAEYAEDLRSCTLNFFYPD